MNLDGKHALVTGAATRVGRRIAQRLLAAGVRLSAHYHTSENDMRSLLSEAGAAGREAGPVRADLRRPEEIRKAVDEAVKARGPVDILVSSASRYFPTPTRTVAPSQWDELFDTNLKGHFFFAREVLGHLPADRSGSIVFIADVYGRRPLPDYLPYAAAKAGLLHLTRGLAKEAAPRVRVNSISPGPVLFPPDYDESEKAVARAKTLLGREGSSVDIAEGVIFLLENDYVTGIDLEIDGGRHLAAW